jgi:hypothetical protein
LKTSFPRIVAASAVLVAIAALTSSTGKASNGVVRRGGPRDWSHGRLVASDYGSDQGQKIMQDWRTYSKHVRLEHARELQNRPNFDLFDVPPFAKHQPKDESAASHLDWSLNTGGFGNVVGAPAKYSFDITASNCSDVIYFTVDQAGAAATPNVIAITNAYAGCPNNALGTTPTVRWGIRMTSGTATSPVPSLDGKVLYVIESKGTGVHLHAINVDNITTGVGTYNFTTKVWSAAHTLAAPDGTATSEQLFDLTFTGVVNDAASPYLDYLNNQIFFGDSTGHIQHVTNVNLTTAAKDTTRFTNACGTKQLQSPVFWNNQVIVTSYNGFLYRLDTTGASPYTCVASAQGGAGTGSGIAGAFSPPIVDVTNNTIIVSTNHAFGFTVSGVGAYALTFASGAAQLSGQQIGPSTATAPVIGAFDDDFWSFNNGNFYVPGANSTSNDTYLVRFPYNGTFGSVAGYAQLHRSGAGAVVATSAVTEFLTASTLANKDFIFTGGGGGTYLFMNRIGAGFSGTNASPTAVDSSFAVPGGAISQIVIDTRTTAITGSTATANIYFGTMGVASTTQSTIVQLAQQF